MIPGERFRRALVGWLVVSLVVFAAVWVASRHGRSAGVVSAPPRPLVPRSPSEGRTPAELSASLVAIRGATDALERGERIILLLASCSSVELRRLYEDPRLSRFERRLLVRRWAEVAAMDCLRHLRQRKWPNIEEVRSVIEVFLANEPDAAIAVLKEEASSGRLHRHLVSLLPTVFSLDVEAGFELLRSAQTDYSMTRGQSTVPDSVWKAAPTAFIERVDREVREGLRGSAVLVAAREALITLAETDPSAAMEAFARHERAFGPEWQPHEFVAVLWKIDPAATEAWIASLPEGSARQRIAAEVAARIAIRDPSAAIAYAQANLTGSAQTSAIARAAADMPPDERRRFVENSPPGALRRRLVESFAFTMDREQGNEAAVDWVLSLPDRGTVAAGALEDLLYTPSALAKAAAHVKANPEGAESAWLAQTLVAEQLHRGDMEGLLRVTFDLPEELVREPIRLGLSAGSRWMADYGKLGSAAETLAPPQVELLGRILAEDVVSAAVEGASDEVRLSQYATVPPGALRRSFVRQLKQIEGSGGGSFRSAVLAALE